MSKVYFIFKTALLALMLGLVTVAFAYTGDFEADEIVVTSTSLTVESQSNTALFEGSVVASVDNLTIYSDSMNVIYSNSDNKVVEVHAIGNVRVHNEAKAIFSKTLI